MLLLARAEDGLAKGCLVLFLEADGVHFQKAAVGNVADLDAHAGRTVVAHEVGVDRVEVVEIVQIGDKDRSLGDVGDGKACLVQNGFQIGQGLGGLFLHVAAHDLAGHGVIGNLAAQIVGGTCLNAVGIGTDRGAGLGCMDELHDILLFEGSVHWKARVKGSVPSLGVEAQVVLFLGRMADRTSFCLPVTNDATVQSMFDACSMHAPDF